jgi:hypothetical protein
MPRQNSEFKTVELDAERSRATRTLDGFALCIFRGTAFCFAVRVRHEGVAETVLLFVKEVTTPAVLPAVSYRGVPSW